MPQHQLAALAMAIYFSGMSAQETADLTEEMMLSGEVIDLSQWIAGNPADVLATNFGKPASLFESFPKKDVFIAPGVDKK